MARTNQVSVQPMKTRSAETLTGSTTRYLLAAGVQRLVAANVETTSSTTPTATLMSGECL